MSSWEAKGRGLKWWRGEGVCADLDLLPILVQLPLDDGLDAISTDGLGRSGESLCKNERVKTEGQQAAEDKEKEKG